MTSISFFSQANSSNLILVALWVVKIAIEHGHLQWVFPLNIAIFNSYLELPEGTYPNKFPTSWVISPIAQAQLQRGSLAERDADPGAAWRGLNGLV